MPKVPLAANADGQLEPSERFYFMYDERWRIVATFRDQDANAKESFVYHASGLAGRGGSSYIDSVILRDRDINNTGGWTGAGDGTLEERRYYAQNWRADVVALTKSDGQPVEFIRYSSYGRAQAFAAADVNRDGVVNSTDAADWDNLYTEASSNAAIPVDFDFDGAAFDPADNDAFYAAYSEASGWSNGSGGGSLGGKLSRIGNRKGYAGYEFDVSVEAYHVRHRVYVPELGRWTKRDPIGYVDGMSLYEYVKSSSIGHSDSMGLWEERITLEPGPEEPSQCTGNYQTARNHPRVISKLASIAAKCPGVPPPVFSLNESCSGRGEFSCSLFGGGTSVTVCGNPGGRGCPSSSSMVATFIHELTHFEQFCRPSTAPGGNNDNATSPGEVGFGGSCWDFKFRPKKITTFIEIEAYCTESPHVQCPPTSWTDADDICRSVDDSGGSYCQCLDYFGYHNDSNNKCNNNPAPRVRPIDGPRRPGEY